MWLADGWKDYEVIDSSDGEKLERWGQYILVRPDPQVIWDTPRTDKRWKHPNAHYHRSKKGGASREWTGRHFFTYEPEGIRIIIFFPSFIEEVRTGMCFLRS